MRVELALVLAVLGTLAFYWAAAGGMRILRGKAAGPLAYVRVGLAILVFGVAGGAGFGFAMARWRERGRVPQRLFQLALLLGCLYGVWYGITGAIRRRIRSRTGVLEGRAAVEHGILLAFLAACGCALLVPALLR